MEENKASKKIIKSALIVIIVTVLAKILGFAREVVMGSVFGTGIDSNIYFWAISITTTIFMAFATAISTSMLPTLKEYKVSNKIEKIQKYLNKIITLGLLISMLVMTVLIFTAPGYVSLIAQKYEGANLQKAILLTQLLIPSIAFIILAYMTKTILQANEKFFMYSIISLPYNLFILAYLIFFADKYGIYGLAISTVIAWALQFLIQLPMLMSMKVKYKVDFKFKDEDIKKFMILIFPLLISTLGYSVNTLVDKSIALNLSDGKVSGLSYGYTVYSSIVTIIIVGISTVLYPKFIESKVLSSNEKFKNEVSKILSIMIYIGFPLMICFIVLNKEIVQIVYMRGNFDATSVELTRYALLFYSLGALGYAIQDTLMKVFYALKESKIPMITSLISVGINLVLDVVLVQYFDYYGLAAATSIAITANAVMLFYMLEKRIGSLNKTMLFKTLIKSGVALIFSGYVARFVIDRLYLAEHRILVNIPVIILAVAAAGVIYLIITYILRLDETKFVFENYLKFGGKKDEQK